MKKLYWWILLLVVGNVVWLILDKNPPAWDQAAHLRSIILTNQWLTGKFWGNGIDLIKVFGGYPPLIYIIGGLWSLIVGVGVVKISFLNTIFFVVSIVGVYKLARTVSKNERVGLLAAVLFSLFPVIYDISRNMLLDLALTGWVVWGLYFLMKKNEKGMWVMLILASLTKLNGFIYFGPMFLMLAIDNYKNKQFWMRMVIGAAIYSVVVGWWWIVNFQNIFQYLTGLAGQGEKLTDPMNLLDWQTWIHYFRLFFLQQVGPIVAMIFLIFGKKENKKLIWWTILTYVIFTIIKNKDFRFTMPILPVVAVWMGWGLQSRLNNLVGKLLVGLLLVWMGFNYIENSFGWPIGKPLQVTTPTFVMGNINWIDFSDYPVREVRAEVWPSMAILEKVMAKSDEKSKVLIGVNIERLNDNSLRLIGEIIYGSNFDKRMELVPVGGETTEFGSEEEIRNLVDGFNQIIVPDPTMEPAPFYVVQLQAQKQLRDYLWKTADEYPNKTEYKLPNGEKVYLFSRV